MVTEQIKTIVKDRFSGEGTGHDWHHIERVYNTACYLQEQEGGDREIIELAALLHDISDHKLNGGELNKGGAVASEILKELNYPEERIARIAEIIDGVSYKGALVPDSMKTIEGMIVQDADRLDAIGAIGIARAFAFGGNRNRPLYDPAHKNELHDSFDAYARSEGHTIGHFYEKLLLLKNRLNTNTARRLGEERHHFMEEFLQQFYKEWNTEL
ncbi:MAG: HD domain-containing protein [Bacteroidota bacterium]|jgi:uncharacterized protein